MAANGHLCRSPRWQRDVGNAGMSGPNADIAQLLDFVVDDLACFRESFGRSCERCRCRKPQPVFIVYRHDKTSLLRTVILIYALPKMGRISNAYISSLANLALAFSFVPTPPAFAQTPSFDCAKATYPDDRTICTYSELSRLDNLANARFEYVRRIYGAVYASEMTLPLLQARHACGERIACIKQQLVAIRGFHRLGAPMTDLGMVQIGPNPYEEITVEDFKLDGKALASAQAKVLLKGIYKKI